MPVETDADRRVFVDADDFAVSVSWIHSGGTATFSAILDDQYQLVSSEFLDAGAEGSTPQITAISADVPVTGRHGDPISVDGRAFKVVEFKPDGTGMTVIRLQDA